MLDDDDLFPITCTECGHETHEVIRSLYKAVRITCGKCGREWHFDKEAFVAYVKEQRKTIEGLLRNSKFIY